MPRPAAGTESAWTDDSTARIGSSPGEHTQAQRCSSKVIVPAGATHGAGRPQASGDSRWPGSRIVNRNETQTRDPEGLAPGRDGAIVRAGRVQYLRQLTVVFPGD